MTTQFRSYKYRLQPTTHQESLLNQFVGARRWFYNYLLEEQKRRFDNKEPRLTKFDCIQTIQLEWGASKFND